MKKDMKEIYKFFRENGELQCYLELCKINFNDIEDELIVCYMMACNAFLGKGCFTRDNFALKCRDYYQDKDKDEVFMSIFQ